MTIRNFVYLIYCNGMKDIIVLLNSFSVKFEFELVLNIWFLL